MIINGIDLNKEYVRGGKTINAVSNAEIFAWSGDFIVIYGESGSGKSTLLNILAGITEPTSGSVTTDILQEKRIGYLPQGEPVLPHYTVLENIKSAAGLNGSRLDEDWLKELLDTLGISNLVNEYPANLSKGESGRVALARALIHKPALIVADEPTSNLDELNSLKIFSLLYRLSRKGAAVIVATHNRFASQYGDRIYHMKSGVLSLETGEYGNL